MKYLSILIFILFLGSSCSEQNEPITAEDREVIAKIVEENDKIYQFLLQTDSGMPELTGILSEIQTLESSSSQRISKTAKSLRIFLTSIHRNDRESDFQKYSEFSLALFPLVRGAEIPNTYKFYCPMTKKYWIARTKTVRNPYSPDMRSCGDLIVE